MESLWEHNKSFLKAKQNKTEPSSWHLAIHCPHTAVYAGGQRGFTASLRSLLCLLSDRNC